MKKLTLICVLIATVSFAQKIQTGAENYKEYLPLLKGKTIGIVTNQTGIIDKKTHLVDLLVEKKIKIKTIFAPEHGFRGTADAGEHVSDEVDAKTGLSIASLYGKNNKPSPEQLKGIDVMVFDLQDVGTRLYTYVSTMHRIMEVCAENNIPLIVMDRPNPNIAIVDGPVLDIAFQSGIGMHRTPLLHGMTLGEQAKMINGQKWLKDGIQCQLTVIPCLNYNRSMTYSLPVRPSPNLPNDQSINLYVSLCLFEGTNISMGRGTEKQFQIYGSPDLPKSDFAFTPKPNFGDKDPLYNGIECNGEDLSAIPRINRLEIKWLIKAYQSCLDKSKFFDKRKFAIRAGNDKLQQQIEAGISEEEIRNSWNDGLRDFKKMRKQYLIYNEK
ncbi:exo-beta-N-acetylmuramidase NamZ domain-containing protein [Flavobacterium sp. W1B]|uniref:exo-beta-N-acetylmuramidase NamZ family protein n=1 Tax=Flavobacterium sp. W1B TaxID=3394146 RepID=UPI0039BCC3A2